MIPYFQRIIDATRIAHALVRNTLVECNRVHAPASTIRNLEWAQEKLEHILVDMQRIETELRTLERQEYEARPAYAAPGSDKGNVT